MFFFLNNNQMQLLRHEKNKIDFYDGNFHFVTNDPFYIYTTLLNTPVAALKPNKAT